MNQSMLRLLCACAMSVGGSAVLTGCGENAKSPTGSGWEVIDFTEPEPAVDTTPTNTDVPDAVIDPESLAPTGAACSNGAQCEGGVCLTGADWPDGYCTTPACSGSCDSPDAGCVDSDLGNFCAEYCSSSSDCRDGYGCQSQSGSPGRVCVPLGDGPSADGEGCTADADCAGGTCLTDWAGGFCTTVGCQTYEDCASPGGEDNKCLQDRGGNLCIRICTRDSECRDGYICAPIGGGDGMCYPDPRTPAPPVPFDDDIFGASNPLNLTCQSVASDSVTIDYDVSSDAVAYMVTPLARDGRSLEPSSISTLTDRIDLARGANSFQSTPAYIYNGSMNPTVVPATKQFEGQLKAGAHQYKLATDSTEVCHYVVEEKELGDSVDLNVYFVDVPNLNAANAATQPNMQAVIEGFDEIWGAAGITINKVRYFDITGQNATRYSVLRSEQDVTDLVALSKAPGPTLDDVLSINIFFTRAFAMDGAIGISMGLPGPAGLHGTVGSGVAFTAEYLGLPASSQLGGADGDAFTAQIIAHEVGHYLGLFHTSEQYGGGRDPLPDTPSCSRISQNCPDYTNLMFPVAGSMESIITEDQKYVLEVNPLTKKAVGGAP